jgi:beta-phosphoglucomutase
MISIGIGDEKTLHEAKYIFEDFTQIENSLLKNLIN